MEVMVCLAIIQSSVSALCVPAQACVWRLNHIVAYGRPGRSSCSSIDMLWEYSAMSVCVRERENVWLCKGW